MSYKKILTNAKVKKWAGAFLIIFGLALHMIPLFPAGWIIIIGFEFLGIRLLWEDFLKGLKNRAKK
jgi:hypothetical protein